MRACWYESDTSSTLQKMSKNSGAMNSHRVSLRIRRRSLKFFTVRAYVCKAHFTLAFMVAATYYYSHVFLSSVGLHATACGLAGSLHDADRCKLEPKKYIYPPT